MPTVKICIWVTAYKKHKIDTFAFTLLLEPGTILPMDVYNEDKCQMRFRLSQKAYLYVFHFDTKDYKSNQLHPQEDSQETHLTQGWHNLPPIARNTWDFENIPENYEVFIVYVCCRQDKALKNNLQKMIDELKQNQDIEKKLTVEEQLKRLEEPLRRLKQIFQADCGFVGKGEYQYPLEIITDCKVSTYFYQAKNKSLLLYKILKNNGKK